MHSSVKVAIAGAGLCVDYNDASHYRGSYKKFLMGVREKREGLQCKIEIECSSISFSINRTNKKVIAI